MDFFGLADEIVDLFTRQRDFNKTEFLLYFHRVFSSLVTKTHFKDCACVNGFNY